MASEQPFINYNGSHQNISFPASSIEMEDGTTAQAAVQSLVERLDNAMNFYGVCSTAANVAAKEISATGFKLETGASIKVKFTNTNTAENPTLNVSGTGAKAIYSGGAAISANALSANTVIEFVYDDTNYNMIGGVLQVTEQHASLSQLTKLNVTAPKTCKIEITADPYFKHGPVEILKFATGIY